MDELGNDSESGIMICGHDFQERHSHGDKIVWVTYVSNWKQLRFRRRISCFSADYSRNRLATYSSHYNPTRNGCVGCCSPVNSASCLLVYVNWNLIGGIPRWKVN